MLASTGGVFEMGRQETIIDERGPNRVDPLLIPKLGPHMSAGRVGRMLGLRGPNTSINSAAKGEITVDQAVQRIADAVTEAMKQ